MGNGCGMLFAHPDFRITICHTNLVIVKVTNNGMPPLPATQKFPCYHIVAAGSRSHPFQVLKGMFSRCCSMGWRGRIMFFKTTRHPTLRVNWRSVITTSASTPRSAIQHEKFPASSIGSSRALSERTEYFPLSHLHEI
jgi:hypothetical protein